MGKREEKRERGKKQRDPKHASDLPDRGWRRRLGGSGWSPDKAEAPWSEPCTGRAAAARL